MTPRQALYLEKSRQGKEIRDLMTQKKITIAELAFAANCSDATINKITKDRPIEGISLDKMFMIRHVLDNQY